MQLSLSWARSCRAIPCHVCCAIQGKGELNRTRGEGGGEKNKDENGGGKESNRSIHPAAVAINGIPSISESINQFNRPAKQTREETQPDTKTKEQRRVKE